MSTNHTKLLSFFGESLSVFKKNWKFIISLGIITLALQILLNALYETSRSHESFLTFIIWGLMLFMGIVIKLGWASIFLKYSHGTHAAWETFRTTSDLWLQYIKVSLWYFVYLVGWSIFVAAPFLILTLIVTSFSLGTLIPVLGILGAVAVGIVLIYKIIQYQFAIYVVLEHTTIPASDAFKKAGSLTEKHMWFLFKYNLLSLGIIILGALCLGVGLIVALPVVKMTNARIYHYLKHHHA